MGKMVFLQRLFVLWVGLAFCCFSCQEKPKTVVKTKPIVFQKEGEVALKRHEADTLITTFDVEIAETEYETQTGLMYRDHMESHQGMLFVFPDQRMHSFYMKNTQIPLDLIFIKADSTIASFQENARPLDESGLSSKVPVTYVLEVNAGLVQQWGLEVGDIMEFTRP